VKYGKVSWMPAFAGMTKLGMEKIKKMSKFLLALSAQLLLSQFAQATPKVVTSIVPLHSLVSSVMDGVATPELLMQGQNSEHNASFTPQQIADLAHADVVFMIGNNLETKLGEISGTETVGGKTFIKMNETNGLITHAIREGGTWEPDGDEPPRTGVSADPHIWLDPENAKLMVKAIASTLDKADPTNAKLYDANASKTLTDIDKLESDLKALLTPAQHKPFIVFHDAYQYFERRFGVTAVGSISNFSTTPPSAQRLEEIHNKINSSNATCVFREPQFTDAAVQTVIEGTKAKSSVLDPIGSDLTPGPKAYGELLREIANNLSKCLR
jgi:zinc transport system substrate-binding protein